MIEIPKCDLCDNQATHMVRDVIQMDTGKGYYEFAIRPPVRTRCDDHSSKSQVYEGTDPTPKPNPNDYGIGLTAQTILRIKKDLGL